LLKHTLTVAGSLSSSIADSLAATPEPVILLLLGCALVFLGLIARHKRSHR
jgi:hypothetical protein